MADQIEQLIRLQELDAELYGLRRKHEEKPQELERARNEVTAQEARVKAAEERLSLLQREQKEREVELQTREENIKKLKGQLFQLKTNKEYSAMQREIDTLKADNSLLEDAILGGFEAIDKSTDERAREREKLTDEQKALAVETKEIEKEIEEIVQEIATLERHRKGMVPDLAAKTLSVYERILDSRDGVALVPIVNESCGGCNRKLPPQIVNEAHLRARLAICESCNRILYVNSPSPSAS